MCRAPSVGARQASPVVRRTGMAETNERRHDTYDFERYLNVRAARGPSFAPDGSRLSFITDITGVGEVWTVPVDLRAEMPTWPTHLTFRSDRAMGATYSPVAEQLLVGGDRGGNERTQLYRLSNDGATFQPLTHEPDVIHQFAGWWEDGVGAAGWSPDGAPITYASNARDRRYFDVYERRIEAAQSDARNGEPRLLLQ